MAVKTKKKVCSRFECLYWFFPLLLALFVRGVYLNNICNSPFKFYHMIRGLDMFTIHSMYKTATPSLYYLFLRLVSALSPEKYFIQSVIIGQLTLGVITVLFVVYISLKLTENKYISCIAGVLYCLYAPVLMYEGFILKEGFYLFFAVFLLFTCFYCSSCKFNLLSMFFLGIILMIPGLVRGIGGFLALTILIWIIYALIKYVFIRFDTFRSSGKFLISRLLVLILGIFIITTSVYYACNKQLPAILSSVSNFRYFYRVGQQEKFKSINTPVKKSKKNISAKRKLQIDKDVSGNEKFSKLMTKIEVVSKNYIRNVSYTLRPYEIPNNLNYYFIRLNLKPLMYLIGPGLLFAFAFAGFFVFLIYWKKYKYPELLIIFSIPVFAACTIFIPIGRYRVVLAPILVIFTAIFFYEFYKQIFEKKSLKIMLLIILYGLIEVMLSINMGKFFLRASDYVTYGQASSCLNSKDPRIFLSFQKAYNMRPDLTFTKTNLIIQALKTGRYDYAEELLAPEYKKYPKDFNIAINYVAALLGKKDFLEANNVLSKIKKPSNVYNLKEFYFNWGEYYFLTGDYTAAKFNYEKLYRSIGTSNDGMFNFVKARLNIINNKRN